MNVDLTIRMALSSFALCAALAAQGVGNPDVEPTDPPPATHGQWSGPWDLEDAMTLDSLGALYEPYVAEIAHAAVLPPRFPGEVASTQAGKVLFINDRRPPAVLGPWQFNDQPTFLWDWRDIPVDPYELETLMVGNTPSQDLFCSGHAFLGNGLFMVRGGLDRPTALGLTNAVGHTGVFILRTDLDPPQWDLMSEPGDARWYPTVIPLHNGGVLDAGHSGHPHPTMDFYRRTFTLAPIPQFGDVGDWSLSIENLREVINGECTPPIICPGDACWGPVNNSFGLGDYPRLQLLSSGQIIYVDGSAPAMGGAQLRSWFLNVDPLVPADCPADPSNPWHWRAGLVGPGLADHAGGNAVHLLTQSKPPVPGRFQETIYLIGGTQHGQEDRPCPCNGQAPNQVVQRLTRMTDPDGTSPTGSLPDDPWTTKAWETSGTDPNAAGPGPKAMRRTRVNGNTVVLPTGELLTGGGTGLDDDPGTEPCDVVNPCTDPPTDDANFHSVINPSAFGCVHRKAAELYRPHEVFAAEWPPSGTGPEQPGWKLLASQQHKRQYHSVAFLLPDGSVGSAGGTYQRSELVEGMCQQVEDHRFSVELYKPWYFFAGQRPSIVAQSWSDSVEWGATPSIDVSVRQGLGVKRLALVRNASVTHAFDSNQRYIEPELGTQQIVAGPGTTWRVQFVVPRTGFLAPPGWYMVFAIDDFDRPSLATWLHIRVPQ